MHIVWSHLFQFAVPPLEKVVRTVVVYAFLLVGLRVAGKRELGQLNSFDLVVLLILSNTVQNAIIGNDNSLAGGLLGATTLLVLNYVVVSFLYKHARLDRLVEGDPRLLVRDGRVMDDALRRERITVAELEAAARKQGIASLESVECARLEVGGALSFERREPSADELRYAEILDRLRAIEHAVGAPPSARPPA